MLLLGENAAPKSLSPHMTTLDLINTPGQVLVDLINTPGLCPRGTNLIIGLSAQQWLGADARAARSLAQY